MKYNVREALIKSGTLGVDYLVDRILSTQDNAEKQWYAQALELNQSQTKKTYVESCLLCSNDFDRISSILEIPTEVIKVYAAVFYEVYSLDRLSKVELLAVEDTQERLMKTWALNQGLDFIAWRLGAKTSISPVEGLQELFSTSMYKAKEACFSGNASEESKEAVKWTKMAMDLARLLKAYTLDTNQAKRDLQLALEEVIPDFEGFEGLE